VRGGLIIPPAAFLLDARVFVSLGILKVAAALEAAAYPVDVLDLSGVSNYMDAVSDYLVTDPEWVGITATTPQMPYVVEIARLIRRRGVKVILGGPHPTLINAAYKSERKSKKNGRAGKEWSALLSEFDVVVTGDGEKAIFAATQPQAFGHIDADDPNSPLWVTEKDLAGLDLPARHLVDLDSYHYTVEGERATSLIGQLGCPFQCAFCGGRASPMLRRSRVRGVPDILYEVQQLHQKYGYKGFMFYDDELNVAKSMPTLMAGIAGLAKSMGVEFRLRGFIKSELFTDEQAESMVRAGFKWILVGFESGSERILTNIRKQATIADNTRCMEIAHRHGLKVKALMSLGHPGESMTTIGETMDWLIKMKVDDFDATIITTYPGTPYYDEAIERIPGVWTYTASSGDRLHSYEIDHNKVSDYYKGDPNAGYKAYVFTDHLSCDGLVNLRGQLEDRVRGSLRIPFNPGSPAMLYEHSMGQPGLPSSILRSSHSATAQGVGT
jgi:radical SAM superfamily enzyme YgiQ (UPF0313 family)